MNTILVGLYYSPSKYCIVAIGINTDSKEEDLYETSLQESPVNSDKVPREVKAFSRHGRRDEKATELTCKIELD
jgi:hypothetical protein